MPEVLHGQHDFLCLAESFLAAALPPRCPISLIAQLSRRKQVVEGYFDVPSEIEDWNPRGIGLNATGRVLRGVSG
jgi:hypothetical protein